ncbi:MAG: hypothetical protein HN837_02480, partial [Chloroflexi bacterium]|nr:hypothetical protein [Chloroflexota bacterium]
MKKFKIYPLLVALLLLLTACSAAPENIAGNAVLGESMATEAVADVQTTIPEADSQASKAAQAEADPPTQQDTPVASSANTTTRTQPPVITETRQGLTYGPDQLVLVFAEGFQPGATVSVSAMHETEGIVKSASANANALGEILIYHYVQPSAEFEDAYP